MGNYLVSNIEYPATQYEPASPEANGVYHEDREVNLSGAVGGSQMYRTYNAEFFPSSMNWQIQTSGLPAYATVQNPDGSIHYYTLNTATGLWVGSGNNAVYNAVDYGLVQGAGQSAAQRAANVAAIQSAVNAAIAKIPGKANGGGDPEPEFWTGGTREKSAKLSPERRRFCPCENATPPSRSPQPCGKLRPVLRLRKSSASSASTKTPSIPGSAVLAA